MTDEPQEPTQKTPKGLEIPVPRREEVIEAFRKIVGAPNVRRPQSITQAEKNAWIAKALAFVPRGSLCQSELIQNLNIVFQNELGAKPDHPSWTVGQIVAMVSDQLGCHPKYDNELLTLDWPQGR